MTKRVPHDSKIEEVLIFFPKHNAFVLISVNGETREVWVCERERVRMRDLRVCVWERMDLLFSRYLLHEATGITWCRCCTVGWQHDIPRQKYTPVYMSNDNDWHLKFYLCWSRLYRVLPPFWPIQGHFSASKDGLLSMSGRQFRSNKFCNIITPCSLLL